MARLFGACAAVAACALVMGQSSSPGPVLLRGNHPTEAATLAGAARAERTMPLDLTIVLGLRHRAALERLLADQQNPASSRYRHWLTSTEFASRFGPTAQQIDSVTAWLKREGFEVTSVNRAGRTIRARGDAETAERTFSTTLVSDGASFANTTDPVIPAEFDGVVVAIMGLDNMHAAVPAGLHRFVPPHSSTQRKPETLALADVTGGGAENSSQTPAIREGTSTAFGPIDVETFYDELPLINAGNTGTPSPDCIALDEDSDYLPSAVTLYDSTFGLTAPVTNVYPDGFTPGVNGDEIETLLDIDYAQATAPGTPIHPYIGFTVYDAISSSVTDNICGAISISFIYCGESSSFFTGLDSLFQEASAQGQSVFIASGDWGAAGLQFSGAGCAPGSVKNPSEMAASPNVTAVGGTTFSPKFNSAGNDTSVVGVGPGGVESGWSDSGGGQSAIFPKPGWQTGTGVPDDKARDIPDVSMIAWAPYVFIGADVNGNAQIQCCWGGTSLASPLWAGYSRVLAVASGKTRLGLLNPAIYGLANAGVASNGVKDVVGGNNSFNGVTGYSAGTGYDLVTGEGSVDMAEFATAFAALPPPTPTETPTATVTATPTPTQTATLTPTPTATSTRTATPTATATVSATATVTATSTPTVTATATISATATASATPTATATATPTVTATSTATSTATPTVTATPTITATPTETQTATATATPTPTPTSTTTSTATMTPTATQTVTATTTATSTPTATLTATATATTTSTPTATATSTATATATSTPTATATATQTPAPVVTPVPSVLRYAPRKMKFGKVTSGASSSVEMVTLSSSNKKKAVPITLEGWTATGDFSVSPGLTTCAPFATLSPGQKCAIALQFKPSVTGTRSGTLTIHDNATNSPQVVHLKGTGE